MDHWGKGSPSAAETAVLDLEVEILKEQERETRRKEAQMAIKERTTTTFASVSAFPDDLLVIDGRPLENGETPTTITTLSGLDSRVD